MTILFYIILGLIAGALAKLILPGKQGGGIIATILLGVAGALLGGLIGNLISYGELSLALNSGIFVSLITSVVGAILVLLVYGMIQRRRTTAA